MADERIGLRLDVEAASAAAATQEVQRLNRAIETTSVTTAQVSKHWADLRLGIDGVSRSMATASTAQLPMAGKGFQSLGLSVLYASQMIEDMQYGVRAILNNIPILVMAMGGSAGLAGALSVVAVAASQLSERWADLTGQTLTEAEMMARLGKETEKTADQMKQLALYKEATARADAMKVAKTPQEQAQEAAVLKAVADGRGRDIAQAIAEKQWQPQDLGDTRFTDEAAKYRTLIQALGNARAGVAGVPQDKEYIDYLRSEIGEMERQFKSRFADDMFALIGKAASDPGALYTVIDAMRQSGVAPELVGRMEDATPEGRAANVRGAFGRAFDEVKDGFWQLAEVVDKRIHIEEEAAEVAKWRALQEKSIANAESERLRAMKAQQNEEQRQAGSLADQYGALFGGRMSNEILQRMMRGEDPEVAAMAAQDMLLGKMNGIKDPRLAWRTAKEVASRARMMAEDMAGGMIAGQDFANAAISENLAPPNTALGRMQRQMIARARMVGGQAAERQFQFAAQGINANGAWSQEVKDAAMIFAGAARDIVTRGIQITL